MTTLRPEVELLLRCARTSVGLEGADRIRMLLGEPIDWECLLWLAKKHKTIPLLF
jgi:hypothetical protein